MNIFSLIERGRELPIFSLQDCQKWFPKSSRKSLILQLWRFAKQGKIVRLKRGLFLYRDSSTRIDPRVIASCLDSRAIVSLETVLHDANITPEIPFAVTCVTPGRTARYQNKQLGTFLFRHIKQSLLFGWDVETFHPYPVKISRPEKALLDLFWFHRFEKSPEEYVDGLRLSVPSGFLYSRLSEYAKHYNDAKVRRMVMHIKSIV